jgi:GntR family histidine utilization transcriptional repressor
VAEEKPQSTLLRIANIGEEITQRGHDHRFELLDMRRESASPEVAAALDLAVGASVFHLHGVHFENELPVQIEDRYVNPRLVPDFMDQDFSAVQPSVYLVRNVQYDQIEHVVDAILPTAEQARLLQMARPALPDAHAPYLAARRPDHLGALRASRHALPTR